MPVVTENSVRAENAVVPSIREILVGAARCNQRWHPSARPAIGLRKGAVHEPGGARTDPWRRPVVREDLRLQGDTGSKTGGDQSEKGNKKRAHRDTSALTN